MISRRSLIRGSKALITSALLLPRKTRAWTHGGSGGGGGYVAKAVHFAGPDMTNYLLATASGIAESGKYSACCWVKFPASSFSGATTDLLLSFGSSMFDPNLINDHLDIAGSFNSDLALGVQDDSEVDFCNRGSADGAIPSDVWCFLGSSADTSGATHHASLVVNGSTVISSSSDNGAGFISGWTKIAIPGSTSVEYGFANPFDISDMQCWVGTYIDFTSASDYANFVAAGKPVNPATAAAAYGQQTLLLSGDASATGFQKNQGTAGDIFTLTGALTNASTHP